MKNSVEITRKYQFGYMLLHHIIAALIIIVFEAIAAWGFLGKDRVVARMIVASVFAVVYFGLMYGYARKLALFDRKSYTPLQPELKWGVMWGIMIAAVMALMLVLNKLNWSCFSNGNGFTNNVSRVFYIIFLIWTAPYFGFVFYANGNIPIYISAIMVISPIVSCILGYLAGMKDFDLISKLDKLTIEKDDEDDED